MAARVAGRHSSQVGAAAGIGYGGQWVPAAEAWATWRWLGRKHLALSLSASTGDCDFAENRGAMRARAAVCLL